MSEGNESRDELRDELPKDLNVSGFVGAYQFPDNSRRKIPAILYIVTSAVCGVLWLAFNDSARGLVNDGMLAAAVVLGVFGLYVLSSSWPMTVDEKQALVHASRAVNFAVGHASAQQVWRGLRSRPTWRVFCYSAEEPPLQRGLVMIDAIDASIVQLLVEANPGNSVN